MNTWNLLLHFLIIFDLVAFGIYFGGDQLLSAQTASRRAVLADACSLRRSYPRRSRQDNRERIFLV